MGMYVSKCEVVYWDISISCISDVYIWKWEYKNNFWFEMQEGLHRESKNTWK